MYNKLLYYGMEVSHTLLAYHKNAKKARFFLQKAYGKDFRDRIKQRCVLLHTPIPPDGERDYK